MTLSQAIEGLDPDFGNNGLVSLDFPDALANTVVDIAITADRKITLACELILELGDYPQHRAYGLCRLNQDGEPDASFGEGGYLRGHFLPAQSAYVFGLAILADGKILLYGKSDTDSDVAHRLTLCLTRFHTNGDRDLSFGISGTVVIDVTPTAQVQGGSTMFQVLPDNRMLVLPDPAFTPVGERWILRLESDGQLDKDFNGGLGRLVIPSAALSNVSGFTVQPDGKIVVFGFEFLSPSDIQGVLIRYHANGQYDPIFGTTGRTFYPGPIDSLNGLATQVEGTLVAMGYYRTPEGIICGTAMKFLRDGQPDPVFNAAQPADSPLINEPYRWLNGAILQNGEVMLAGTALPTANERNKVMVARYLASGQPDPRFGNGAGWESTGLPERSFQLRRAVMQGDTRFVCAGPTTDANMIPGNSCVVAFRIQE